MLGFFFSSLTLPQSNIIRKRHSKMVMPNHFVANPLLTERKKNQICVDMLLQFWRSDGGKC